MTTIRVLRAPVLFPVAMFQTLWRSIYDFAESLRLGLEVSGEIDHSNQLTPRGRALLGLKSDPNS